MTDPPRNPLDYAVPTRRPPVSVLKWSLFAAAVLFSLVSFAASMGPGASGNGSVGGATAGLWIAFALLHVNDQKQAQR